MVHMSRIKRNSNNFLHDPPQVLSLLQVEVSGTDDWVKSGVGVGLIELFRTELIECQVLGPIYDITETIFYCRVIDTITNMIKDSILLVARSLHR